MLGPQFAGIAASKVLGASGLLLDDFPNAAAAYSLRKLRDAYTGSAIRVRESGGDTEADIGFDGNDLDETALLNHCGANDGFVVTWYDQSGNGENATQSTAGDQYQIVSSGSVIKLNGKPAVDDPGGGAVSPYTVSSNVRPSTELFGVFVSDSNDGASFTDTGPSSLSNGEGYRIDVLSGEARLGLAFSGSSSFLITSSSGLSSGTQSLITYQWNGSGREIFVNNTSKGDDNTTGTLDYSSASGTRLCGRADGGQRYVSKWQEFIIWASDQAANRDGINTAINNYYSTF